VLRVSRASRGALLAGFVVALLSTTPMAWNTPAVFGVQNVTTSDEFQALAVLGSLGARNVTTDQRMADVGRMWFGYVANPDLPQKLRDHASLEGADYAVVLERWTTVGAQVHPAPNIVLAPDTLVYGGDILGKLLVPLFDDGGGAYHWYPSGEKRVAFAAADRPKVERQIADQGRYSMSVTPDRWAELQRDRKGLEAMTLELGRARVRAWLRLIEERLTPKGVPIVMNVGNDDTDDLLDLLRKEAPPNVLVPEGDVVPVGPYEMWGCGYANMTPWRCARDLEEVDLQKVIDRTSGRMGNPKKTILDIHAPPLNTG